MATSFEAQVTAKSDLVQTQLSQENGHKKLSAKLNLNLDPQNIKPSEIAVIDHLFRMTIYNSVLKMSDIKNQDKLVNKIKIILTNIYELCIKRKFPCSEAFQILAMVFDMVRLKVAENLFSLLDIWQAHFKHNPSDFNKQVQQCTLRLCNDLLRRLSTTGSRDIKFSGKVQLYLTQIFPIDEKSGLNLPSNFNNENTTEFTSEADTALSLEIDTTAATSIKLSMDDDSTTKPPPLVEMDSSDGNNSEQSKVTYKIYKSIWSLQRYFNHPCLLFDNADWMAFEYTADFVLGLLYDYQVEEDSQNKNAKTGQGQLFSASLEKRKKSKVVNGKNGNEKEDLGSSSEEEVNFPKYLTSEQLCHLQIKDPNFRRQYIIQFMIVLQYISTPPMKGPKLDASGSIRTSARQRNWVSKTNKKIDEILSKMSRKQFNYQIIQHEVGWNHWKDKSCPSLEISQKDKNVERRPFEKRPSARGIKRSLERAEDLDGKIKKIRALHKSYKKDENINITSEYMEFIKKEKYDDVPTPVKFFESGFEVDNPVWRYKALRLLSEKSRLFWQMQTPKQNFKPLKDFLENYRERINKEVAEWDAEEERKNNELKGCTGDADSETDEEDESGPATNDCDMQDVSGCIEKTEKVDNIKKEAETNGEIANVNFEELQVDDNDVKRLYKLFGNEWEAFGMMVLRLRSAEMREVKSDGSEGIQLFELLIRQWQNINYTCQDKTNKKSLHAAIVKNSRFADKVKSIEDWAK